MLRPWESKGRGRKVVNWELGEEGCGRGVLGGEGVKRRMVGGEFSRVRGRGKCNHLVWYRGLATAEVDGRDVGGGGDSSSL